MGVLIWDDGNVSELGRGADHKTLNALNAAELLTLKGLILCRVNFISTEKTVIVVCLWGG